MDENNIAANLNKLRNIDLNLLTVFEAVYLNKGIVNAAKALNLTPSSVSQSIQKLRNTFPDPLFIRSGQGITPTSYAENLHSHISKGLGSIITGLDFSRNSENKRFLTVCCRPHIALLTFPSIYKELLKINENYTLLHIPMGDNEEMLSQFKADIIIDVNPIYNKSIASVKLFTNKIIAICRTDHPRLDKHLNVEQSREEKYAHLLIDDPMVKRKIFELDEQIITRNITFTTHNVFNIIGMVSTSDLIAYIPLEMYNLFGSAFNIKRLETTYPLEDFDVILHYNKAVKKDKTLMSLISAICASLSPQTQPPFA
jgi:DNA-binding transcriptional LysR family regulator